MESKALTFAQLNIDLFTRILFLPDDLIEIRNLPSGRRQWVPARMLTSLAASLLNDNSAGDNIYIAANPRKCQGSSREDVLLARSLFVDDDKLHPNDLIAKIGFLGLPPATIVVASGHGSHAYWLLHQPIHDLDLWTAYQKSLIQSLGTDKAIHDPPRIMRLPGFLNLKKENRVLCSLVDFQSAKQRIYPLSTFKLTVNANKTRKRNPAGGHHLSGQDLAKAMILARSELQSILPAIQGQHGDQQTFKAAALLVADYALPFKAAFELLKEFNERCCPQWSDAELIQKLTNAMKYRKNGLGSKVPNLKIFDELEVLRALDQGHGSTGGNEL